MHVITAMMKISALGERDDNENIPLLWANVDVFHNLIKLVRVTFALKDVKLEDAELGLQKLFPTKYEQDFIKKFKEIV